MTVFNFIRYILSLLLLIGGIAISFFTGPILGVIIVFVLLYLNNCIDDVVFYQGSRSIRSHKYRGGVACPVNGVVTCIESDVPLMGHILKCDYLDGDILLELESHGDGKLYNHVTIFLNKFNCHAVTNIGSPIVAQREYNHEGMQTEMVEDGDLVSKTDGRFLCNSFIRADCENGVICVYTLDKYVSKMISSESCELLGVDFFICRGSQCDIYVPTGVEFCVNEDEILINLQTICEGEKLPVPGDYGSKVGALFRDDRSAGIGYILFNNFKKTVSTYSCSNRVILTVFMVSMLWFGIDPATAWRYPFIVVEALTGLFALDRFFKNFCYSLFNNFGFKPGLASSYRGLHRVIGWK